MGKPRLIILIRHAQSEGNKNRDIHQTTPDHRVKLTADGQRQALEAGRKLRSLLRPDDTLHFFTSPYRRTRETTEGMLQSLTSDDPEPSPFPRHTIKVYEEPRLREQDFGNFQPSSAEMTRMWHERAEYGHFFYRIPNGESAADAYDRVSGFNESLWRSFREDDFASVCVLVTHGLMTRVFLMKWYHWSVEYFEDLRNMNHCEFVVMQRNDSNGKFVLKNQLRTWTQWRREQAEAKKEEERRRKTSAAAAATIESSPVSVVPVRTKWGTISDNDHLGFADARRQQAQSRRQNTADLFQEDGSNDLKHLTDALEKQSLLQSSAADRAVHLNDGSSTTTPDGGNSGSSYRNTAAVDPSRAPSFHARRREILSSGRDGGGSESGRASRAGSESEEAAMPVAAIGLSADAGADASGACSTVKMSKAEQLTEEERRRQFRPPSSMRLALNDAFAADGSVKAEAVVAMADALGDQSDMDETETDNDDDDDNDTKGNIHAKRERELETGFGGSVR